MPGGVKEDPPGIPRLVFGHRCPELDGCFRGAIKVRNRKVEVELFAAMCVWPRWWLMVFDAPKPECVARAGQHGVVALGVGNWPAQQM